MTSLPLITTATIWPTTVSAVKTDPARPQPTINTCDAAQQIGELNSIKENLVQTTGTTARQEYLYDLFNELEALGLCLNASGKADAIKHIRFEGFFSDFTETEKQKVLDFADNLYLLPEACPGQVAVAGAIIRSLAPKVSPEKQEQIEANAKEAADLFWGLPYTNGMVAYSGNITNGRGLNCMTYANIFDNLALGIPQYDYNLSDMIAEDMFTQKEEYIEAGIIQKPILELQNLNRIATDRLDDWLIEYGSLFNIQLFTSNDPNEKYESCIHMVVAYRQGDQMRLTESNPWPRDGYNSGIVDERIERWLPFVTDLNWSITVSLLDTEQAQPFAHGKTDRFMDNLRSDIDKIKDQ